MKIRLVSRKELIDILLDTYNEYGGLDEELTSLLQDLSGWNG